MNDNSSGPRLLEPNNCSSLGMEFQSSKLEDRMEEHS